MNKLFLLKTSLSQQTVEVWRSGRRKHMSCGSFVIVCVHNTPTQAPCELCRSAAIYQYSLATLMKKCNRVRLQQVRCQGGRNTRHRSCTCARLVLVTSQSQFKQVHDQMYSSCGHPSFLHWLMSFFKDSSLEFWLFCLVGQAVYIEAPLFSGLKLVSS